MSLTPFEIRLELLKMAKDMLVEDYFGKREIVSNQWQTQVESSRLKGETPPAHPGFPDYPTEEQVVHKATQLNNFVSQVPQAQENKTSKKST